MIAIFLDPLVYEKNTSDIMGVIHSLPCLILANMLLCSGRVTSNLQPTLMVAASIYEVMTLQSYSMVCILLQSFYPLCANLLAGAWQMLTPDAMKVSSIWAQHDLHFICGIKLDIYIYINM